MEVRNMKYPKLMWFLLTPGAIIYGIGVLVGLAITPFVAGISCAREMIDWK